MEVCTPDVNDNHNVILVPSSRRSVTEYTLHQFQELERNAVHRARTFGFSGVPLFVTTNLS